jgi:D-lyxose ketol-isomerase
MDAEIAVLIRANNPFLSQMMKRSEIHAAIRRAAGAFAQSGWSLPPNPKWDVTDFGLRRFEQVGLVLVNLTEEPEYCEKLMFSMENQVTPMHAHRIKKEDIICRAGSLALELWRDHPSRCKMGEPVLLKRNGIEFAAETGRPFTIAAGERVTLVPGVYHAFRGHGGDCIVGEVSTANDDANDNFFVDPDIGRFPEIEEDEPATVRLIREVSYE